MRAWRSGSAVVDDEEDIDWLGRLGYGECDERELFYGRSVDTEGFGVDSLFGLLRWLRPQVPSLVQEVCWKLVEVLVLVEGWPAWGPVGCGMITVNLGRPAVMWYRGVLRPPLVKQVLSLSGWMEHCRREEWVRSRP